MSGGDDKTVRLWDTRGPPRQGALHTFYEHTGIVTSVAYQPDGMCVASGSADRSVKVWDLRTMRLFQHYEEHSDAVNSVSFHPSGKYLVTASSDSTLKMLDLVEGRLCYTLHGHGAAVNTCDFSPSGSRGEYFASGAADSTVLVRTRHWFRTHR